MGGKPAGIGDPQPSGDVPMPDVEQPTTTGRQPIDRSQVGRRGTGIPGGSWQRGRPPTLSRRQIPVLLYCRRSLMLARQLGD